MAWSVNGDVQTWDGTLKAKMLSGNGALITNISAGAELDPVYTAWDKDHADLSNVTADQHHAEAHNHTGVYDPAGTAATGDTNHLGNFTHSNIALNTAARHAEAHAHTHASTTGQTATDHHSNANDHAQSHDHDTHTNMNTAAYTHLTATNHTDLTDGGATTLHSHAGGGGINTLRTTADQTINAGAGVFTNITNLTFAVVSGTDYAFHFYITFRSAASTTGWRAGVNCPTGVLDFWAQSDIIANGAAGVATHTERHNTVRDDMTLLTGTITQAVDLAVRIEGRYKCTANGTFAARFANELASNTQIVVQKGSWGYWF